MLLIKVENVLKEFQIQNGTLCIEAQSKAMKAMIEATAMIQARTARCGNGKLLDLHPSPDF